MKFIVKYLSIVLFLLISVLCISFGVQKAEWKGTIEEEDGIKVIKNPREPMYGEIKFELEEDLSIGNDRDNNYLFYRIRDVAIDNQGNIFVVDAGNFRVQKFDQNGKYVLTIGREGQGPGEFERPALVKINERNGNIYVKDKGIFIEIFDREGNHIRQIRLSSLLGVVSNFYILENENLLLKVLKTKDVGKALEAYMSVALVNPQGILIRFIADYPFNIQWIRKGFGGVTGFETELCFASLDLETNIIGFPEEYSFDITDKDGKTKYRIHKEESIPKYTSEEKSHEKKLPFPPEKPFYYDILTDSEKRIYVQKNNTAGGGPTDNVDKQVDVFSKDGHFLYKSILPANTVLIRDGLLYAYVIDEEKGGEYIKRYIIKNWDQIKTGI